MFLILGMEKIIYQMSKYLTIIFIGFVFIENIQSQSSSISNHDFFGNLNFYESFGGLRIAIFIR